MNYMRSSLTAVALLSGLYLRLGLATSTRRRAAVVLAILITSSPWSASAQAREMLGARVRVQSSSQDSTEGVVVEWGPTLLGLRTTEGRTSNLAWAEVTDVTQYRGGSRTVQGAVIGGVSTAFVGGILFAAFFDPCPPSAWLCIGPDSRAEGFAIGAGLGVVAGGAAGALIGALINTSSWEPVFFPSASLGLAGPLGVRLGVSFR